MEETYGKRTLKLVGRMLRRYRKNHGEDGLTMDEVVERCRVLGQKFTQPHLSQVENGNTAMSLDDFAALLRVLGITPNQAFAIDDMPADPDAVGEVEQMLAKSSPERRRLYMALLRILAEGEREERQKNDERWQSLLATAKLFGGDELIETISDLTGVDLGLGTAPFEPRAHEGGEETFNQANSLGLFSRG